MIHPAIHDHGRTMGGHDNLDIRIQFQHQTDELLLPLQVKTDFRFIHKEDIRLVVLHQHGEQDGKNLLFASRKLIRQKLLAHLVESDFIGCSDDGLSGILEKIIYHILEHPLGFAQLLSLEGGIRFATLQYGDDAVADVHLIIQILALQLEELPVEFGNQSKVYLVDHLGIHQWSIYRSDYIVANPLCLLRLHLQVYALDHVTREFAASRQTLYHLIQYSTLAHADYTTQDIDTAVEVPKNMFGTAPKRFYLYLFDIISIFLLKIFSYL